MRSQRLLRISLAATLLASACSAQATVTPAEEAQSSLPSTSGSTGPTPIPADEFLLPLPVNRAPAPAIERPPAGTEAFASATSDADRVLAAYVPQSRSTSDSYYHGEVAKIDVLELSDGRFATTSPGQIRVWQPGEPEPSATVGAGSGPTWKGPSGKIANVELDGRHTVYYEDLEIATQSSRAPWVLDEIHSVVTHPDFEASILVSGSRTV